MEHPVKSNGETVTQQEEENIRLWVREGIMANDKVFGTVSPEYVEATYLCFAFFMSIHQKGVYDRLIREWRSLSSHAYVDKYFRGVYQERLSSCMYDKEEFDEYFEMFIEYLTEGGF